MEIGCVCVCNILSSFSNTFRLRALHVGIKGSRFDKGVQVLMLKELFSTAWQWLMHEVIATSERCLIGALLGRIARSGWIRLFFTVPADMPDLSTPKTLRVLKKIIPSAAARHAIHFRFERRLLHREGLSRGLLGLKGTWSKAFVFAFTFAFVGTFAFSFVERGKHLIGSCGKISIALSKMS